MKYTTFPAQPGEQRAKKYRNCGECGAALPERGHPHGRMCHDCYLIYQRECYQARKQGKKRERTQSDCFTVGGYKIF
jgi:hypothetical protein